MAFLTRAELLARLDVRKYADVDGVRVKSLSSGERLQWLHALSDKESGIDPTALIVVLGAVDENGQRLFPQIQDVDAVSEGDGGLVAKIADSIAELSGLGDDAEKDAEKNSVTSPSESSSSDSAESSEPPKPSSDSD